MFRLICLLLGYAIGCVQTGYIVGKMKGIDIRNYESGNAGATNVTRVLGKKAGLIVFLCDIFKGALGYTICYYVFKDHVLAGLYGGLGVVLGHNFPFYLKFKGGKGIASTIGIIICLNFVLALLVFGIAFIFFYITKYISVGSLLIVLGLPLAMMLFGYQKEPVTLGFVFMALAYYQHKGNIVRIFNGSERKFYFKSRKGS